MRKETSFGVWERVATALAGLIVMLFIILFASLATQMPAKADQLSPEEQTLFSYFHYDLQVGVCYKLGSLDSNFNDQVSNFVNNLEKHSDLDMDKKTGLAGVAAMTIGQVDLPMLQSLTDAEIDKACQDLKTKGINELGIPEK